MNTLPSSMAEKAEASLKKAKYVSTYLTPDEVGKILGCSPDAVRRLFTEGELTGYRLPGCRYRRISAWSLYQYLLAGGKSSDGLDAFTAAEMQQRTRLDLPTKKAELHLSEAQVAVILHLTRNNVGQLRLANAIRSRRAGTVNRYTIEDVQTYLESQKGIPINFLREQFAPHIAFVGSTQERQELTASFPQPVEQEPDVLQPATPEIAGIRETVKRYWCQAVLLTQCGTDFSDTAAEAIVTAMKNENMPTIILTKNQHAGSECAVRTNCDLVISNDLLQIGVRQVHELLGWNASEQQQ